MKIIKILIQSLFKDKNLLIAPDRSVIRTPRPWDAQVRASTHFSRVAK